MAALFVCIETVVTYAIQVAVMFLELLTFYTYVIVVLFTHYSLFLFRNREDGEQNSTGAKCDIGFTRPWSHMWLRPPQVRAMPTTFILSALRD